MIKKVKNFFKGKFPKIYALVRSPWRMAVSDFKILKHLGVRNIFLSGMRRQTSWKNIFPLQRPRRFIVKDIHINSTDELEKLYLKSNESFSEGGHTVYLTPRTFKEEPFKELSKNYPEGAGLKISKLSGGYDTGRYIDWDSPGVAPGLRSITYLHKHQMLMANFLYLNGIGMKLYDVVEIEFTGKERVVAYVTQDLDGNPVTDEQSQLLVNKIRKMEKSNLVRVIVRGGLNHGDFKYPECTKHILLDKTSGEAKLVDFQSLIFTNYSQYLSQLVNEARKRSHFGNKSFFRGGKYLYQSIPGFPSAAKRNIDQRFSVIRKLMESANVNVEDKIVLDIGCNIGMAIANYLKMGAFWCHGWDKPNIVVHTEKLLYAVGCTRFNLTGANIEISRDLIQDIPFFLRNQKREMVISYLAVQGHLGWLDCLSSISWSYLIYEGHENETEYDFKRIMSQLSKKVSFEIASKTTYMDGDSRERHVAILIRTQALSKNPLIRRVV